MVEDDGEPYTTNLCLDFSLQSKEERNQRKTASKGRSRGKLSAGLGFRGFENKMLECCAAKEMFAKS